MTAASNSEARKRAAGIAASVPTAQEPAPTLGDAPGADSEALAARTADHAPLRVVGLSDFPDWVFINCACGERPIANVWLRDHWTGDPEDGKAAVSQVIKQQADEEARRG